jgi:hypothetical protein
MPLVFAESEVTAAGIAYADRTGISYQYPRRYRRAIQPGERFVYYKGRRKHDGSRAPQVYFGAGVVGESKADPGQTDRFVCEILDYRAFPVPVPFKDAGGQYLESGGHRRGYFQPGVRTISDQDLGRILEDAELRSEVSASSDLSPALTEADLRPETASEYASPDKLRAVEEFAVRTAVEHLRRKFPNFVAQSQARNNPGFDIMMVEADASNEIPATRGSHFYVEVKGTTRMRPVFFISEGELRFARRNADRFCLLVVYKIRLDEASCEIFWHRGAIADGAGFQLNPMQWTCEALVATDRAK